MNNRHDVVVIGSGHNGLICAAYIARSGLDVHVVEKDTVLGGATSTVERYPGHRTDRGSSAHLMIRHTGIPEELDLAAHGLRYVDCDPWGFAPAPPGSDDPPIVFHRDLDATCASIAAACGETDAHAYRGFVRRWGVLAGRMMKGFGVRPTASRLGAAFLGRDDLRDPFGAVQTFLASGDALLDQTFTSERLKAALSWFGAQSGPPMSHAGTAPMIGFAALMHQTPPGRAIGGSGALADALVSAVRAAGGSVTAGAGATAIRRAGSGWRVETAGGGSLHCSAVVAACHVHTTLDLLSHELPAAGLDAWRRRIRPGFGLGMVVRLGTTDLPRYPGVSTTTSAHGLQLLVTDRRRLDHRYGVAAAGRLDAEPAVLAMSFSSLDPSLAPAGRHELTLWSQWHPRHLADGRSWSEAGPGEADRIIAAAERFAPGLTDSIVHRHVQTPQDLETELGLIGGNVMHVEMSLDQMLPMRPHPDLAGHTVPGADGVFLAGASTHPGGGVIGTSGRTVARLVGRRLGTSTRRRHRTRAQ
ncbi:FAD-dependent oxidoreductase [Dietzia natronolimnaea]|uniref:FAD-dependent oxidoreductase n=1 Tax=Dietzia natronolimnaea TaxID=161920 RepID=A0A2A2WSY9_9ACTN|nr:NAD(P)/FAD-dependent oxidoreductase [Dietzia natronolimnaea]PAY24349.1 FAD-dependent oxidoreductase [Dietzia natronolimnaea]